ncbi:hypothetical protein BCR42DRAFT_424476 [Absidia repens]|uniref:Zn(2)-C6 fungal-type domain-containing protein n=1 Tax=Absidia repens TaxID=90262 RepID=A0A1X2I3F6_9FUNG|nr:hypothetical protein BCR42DRAFT_424476 [Absidia repens]
MQKNIQPLYTLPSQVPIAAADMPTIITSSTKRSKKVKESKRRQVKNACINCQKACKKCDEGRACQRCIKLGIESTCVDSPRKERLRGVKRGPYKKRQPKNVTNAANQLQSNDQDKPFYFDQDFKWLDNTQIVNQQQYQQPQPFKYEQNSQQFNQIQYTTYQGQQYESQPQQESACFSTDLTIGNDSYTTPYYSSSPIDQQFYQQSSVNSTPSPLTNSVADHYASPVSSSFSISPASSNMPLPQDVLQSMIAINDLIPADMDALTKQEDLDFDGMMMMPLLDTPILNWSTTPTSNTFNFAAPNLAQPVYHQYQQQEDYIPQPTQYIPFC